MIVFTCGHCGEAVQEPKVEKHYLMKCRNRDPNLSCMDCFEDFLGDDYQNHTKCVTKEQMYSEKDFVATEKKGERKHNAWVEMLQSVLNEQKKAPRNVLRIIETISQHNNTPRKKPKFITFVKHVCGPKINPKDIDQAWDLISVKLSELFNDQNQNKHQKSDTSASNGKAELHVIVDVSNEEKQQNGIKPENGDTEQNEETLTVELQSGDEKKMSNKQRKEKKKREKYEAELQSASVPPTEIQEEVQTTKKDKKKKSKSNAVNSEVKVLEKEGNSKNEKLQPQDTVDSIHETNGRNNSTENNENIENEPVNEEKNQKKKQKVENDERILLHDQNVAESQEITTGNKCEFNWHRVIISLLRQKKSNELPLKRFEKIILTEYTQVTGQEVDIKTIKKFKKELKSAPKVKKAKDRVLLVQ